MTFYIYMNFFVVNVLIVLNIYKILFNVIYFFSFFSAGVCLFILLFIYIDDLNMELAKIKKENFELQDIIEKLKIKSKKQEEYCIELEKKIKLNVENEKKFHSDYL